MKKSRHEFTVKIKGSGDGKTLEEVMYSMSDLILETLAKAKSDFKEEGGYVKIEQGKQSIKSVV